MDPCGQVFFLFFRFARPRPPAAGENPRPSSCPPTLFSPAMRGGVSGQEPAQRAEMGWCGSGSVTGTPRQRGPHTPRQARGAPQRPPATPMRAAASEIAIVPGKVLLKLDFRNAFNTIDRSIVLKAVRERLPTISPWVEFCYADPSRLFFDGAVLFSEEGVQQGDPLGPLLFALALQPLVRKLAARGVAGAGSLDLVEFYLDDGVLAGPVDAVADAL
eukprot:gene19806-biopygen19481